LNEEETLRNERISSLIKKLDKEISNTLSPFDIDNNIFTPK
jgi:hypothetical protein